MADNYDPVTGLPGEAAHTQWPLPSHLEDVGTRETKAPRQWVTFSYERQPEGRARTQPPRGPALSHIRGYSHRAGW